MKDSKGKEEKRREARILFGLYCMVENGKLMQILQKARCGTVRCGKNQCFVAFYWAEQYTVVQYSTVYSSAVKCFIKQY